jgi:hypothetical protein
VGAARAPPPRPVFIRRLIARPQTPPPYALASRSSLEEAAAAIARVVGAGHEKPLRRFLELHLRPADHAASGEAAAAVAEKEEEGEGEEEEEEEEGDEEAVGVEGDDEEGAAVEAALPPRADVAEVVTSRGEYRMAVRARSDRKLLQTVSARSPLATPRVSSAPRRRSPRAARSSCSGI